MALGYQPTPSKRRNCRALDYSNTSFMIGGLVLIAMLYLFVFVFEWGRIEVVFVKVLTFLKQEERMIDSLESA